MQDSTFHSSSVSSKGCWGDTHSYCINIDGKETSITVCFVVSENTTCYCDLSLWWCRSRISSYRLPFDIHESSTYASIRFLYSQAIHRYCFNLGSTWVRFPYDNLKEWSLWLQALSISIVTNSFIGNWISKLNCFSINVYDRNSTGVAIDIGERDTSEINALVIISASCSSDFKHIVISSV